MYAGAIWDANDSRNGEGQSGRAEGKNAGRTEVRPGLPRRSTGSAPATSDSRRPARDFIVARFMVSIVLRA